MVVSDAAAESSLAENAERRVKKPMRPTGQSDCILDAYRQVHTLDHKVEFWGHPQQAMKNRRTDPRLPDLESQPAKGSQKP